MTSWFSRQFQAARDALRWRGPFIFILLLFREAFRPLFYWYAWRVFEVDLSQQIVPPYTREQLESRLYTPRDAAAACADLAPLGRLAPSEIDRRFARGDCVVAVFLAERPVGCIWLALANGPDLVFDTFWIIRPGEAMKYGSFVLPDFRGRAIHSYVSYAANCHLRSMGITRAFSVISLLNTPSMSLAKHHKRAAIMTIFLARVRGLNWTFRKSFGAPLESRFFWKTASPHRKPVPAPDSPHRSPVDD